MITSLFNDNMKTHDIIVIGGGPAGSTAAALLAQKRQRVILFERERFPRFCIGESLMPGTYSTLKRLGVLDKMKKSVFPKKYSVQFYSKSGRPSKPFYFFENDSHERSVTWQVLRSEFDQMLLDNAREKGAEVHQGVTVLGVLFEGSKAVGVRVRMPDKTIKEFEAKVVVDASGQSALVARTLKITDTDPGLKKASVYTHFQGGLRDQGVDEGATIVYHTENQDSWFWYIPLPNDVVSVGVVGSLDYLFQNRKDDAQKIFSDELAICPALQPRLQNAKQSFPVKATKDFTYRASQIAGEGWVLIGDAFGFLDPIYSSGVFLALKSGELAADAIIQAFEKHDFSDAQLGNFGPEFVAGMEAIRKLVYAFYSKDFSFAKFLKQFPACKTELVNILIGDVFRSEVDGIFESMSQFCELPPDRSLKV